MKHAWLLLLCGCAAPAGIPDAVHPVIPGLYLGAEPDEPVFHALAALGVKTLISVDGAKPDVAAAARHGLRYVHLPIGYDGITPERRIELAQALTDLPGPVYVHCHHGKHRAPAAAAVACVLNGRMDGPQALDVLRRMGTGEQYLGLWAAVRDARAATPEERQRWTATFRETAPIAPFTEAMVGLDHAFENLGRSKSAGWKPPPEHPDVDPAHEALKAREILAEIARSDSGRIRPADYRRWLNDGLKAAVDLERGLRAKSSTAELDAVFERFRKTCADCHRPYRNAPKK